MSSSYFFFCMLNRTKTSEEHAVFKQLFGHQGLFFKMLKRKSMEQVLCCYCLWWQHRATWQHQATWWTCWCGSLAFSVLWSIWHPFGLVWHTETTAPSFTRNNWLWKECACIHWWGCAAEIKATSIQTLKDLAQQEAIIRCIEALSAGSAAAASMTSILDRGGLIKLTAAAETLFFHLESAFREAF